MADEKKPAAPQASKPAAVAPAVDAAKKTRKSGGNENTTLYAYQRVVLDYLKEQGIVPVHASKGTIVLKKPYELLFKEGQPQYDKFLAFAAKNVDISFSTRG